MDNQRGKLLISTKAQRSGRKMLLRAIGIIGICFGVLILIFEQTNRALLLQMGQELYSSPTAGVLLVVFVAIFMIGYGAYDLALSVRFRSYCEIYEHAVVGKTTISMRSPKDPMRDFEIPYKEIVNVSEAGQMLYIQTAHESFDILAERNRTEAVREIRARMGAGN